MEESLTQNPETNMYFQLNPENVNKLKLSVAALCDAEFNPTGEAMVDVTEKGFELTVRNNVTRAVGHLFLEASRLIDFHCNNPIVGKIISIDQIYELVLKYAVLEDTNLTVIHADDFTSNLTFKFGNDPDNELSIEFWDNEAEFDKFPDVEFSCETVLGSMILMEMIARLGDNPRELHLVSMHISEKQVIIFVDLPTQPYQYVTNHDDENFDARVLTPGKEYHAWFELLHLDSIKKASVVAPRFHLRYLTTEPLGEYMIRFNLEELGELVFIQEARLI